MQLVQQLFLQDDGSKDVTITLDDGLISAHKCILQASSEAFAGILRNGREQASGRLTIAGTNLRTMKVLLRLIYTGLVDEDWEGEQGSLLPLDLLLKVAGLAKRYMVSTVMSMTAQALNNRLEKIGCSSWHQDDALAVESFEKIFAFAIKEDIRPILLKGCALRRTLPL